LTVSRRGGPIRSIEAGGRVNQRKRTRYRIWLPLKVRWGDRETAAVTYDASENGVMMLAPVSIAVGTKVTVTFEVPGEAPKQRTGEGKVVRSGPNEDDPHGLWGHRLAVALDEAMDAFQKDLDEVAKLLPLAPKREA
jgi:PilZ domain